MKLHLSDPAPILTIPEPNSQVQSQTKVCIPVQVLGQRDTVQQRLTEGVAPVSLVSLKNVQSYVGNTYS